MLRDRRVIAFIATRQADRARDFYGQVLGLRLVADTPFALVFDAGGTELRIQKVTEMTPARHTALGWRVPDVDAVGLELSDRGVDFVRFDGLSQDDRGIWTSPDGHRVAWFHDPDGNVLSLTQDSTG